MIQVFLINLAPPNTRLMLGCMFKDTRVNLKLLDSKILEGIKLNEKIASFINQHPAYHRSKKRLNYRFVKHADKILFVFYDHFLTANWTKYNNQPLGSFAEETYAYLLANMNVLPYCVKKNIKTLLANDWIINMASIRGVHEYMQLITIKDTFQSILEYSLEDLTNNYNEFKEDFEEIMPDLIQFMKDTTTRIAPNFIFQEEPYRLLESHG
jgi:acyl carrier protein phosphodiesterase